MTWAPELWALAVALAALVVAWRARADLADARAELRAARDKTARLGDALHRWNNAELVRLTSQMDRWRMVAAFARDVSVASGWRIPPPDFCGRQPGDPPSSPPISGSG